MPERFICENIRISTSASDGEALEEAARRLKKAGISRITELELHKKSLDARRRGNTCFVCSAVAVCEDGVNISDDTLTRSFIKRRPKTALGFPRGTEPMSARPVIVGFGPAGMFAALTLAEHGFAPLVLERGASLDGRIAKVDAFFGGGKLDTETNVQFGAGGAGTFSDGKTAPRKACLKPSSASARPGISFIRQSLISEPTSSAPS